MSVVGGIGRMVSWLGRNGLGVFGYWRIAAGVVVGGLLFRIIEIGVKSAAHK